MGINKAGDGGSRGAGPDDGGGARGKGAPGQCGCLAKDSGGGSRGAGHLV